MNVATDAWLDQEDAHLRAVIRRYGWFVQYVSGDSACSAPGCDCGGGDGLTEQSAVSFAYTVGLFGMGHPELLILGVPQQTAAGAGAIVFAANRFYERPPKLPCLSCN